MYPKVNGGSLSKICKGAQGTAEWLEVPQKQQGFWGAAALPVKTILWTQSQDFGTRIYREPIVNLRSPKSRTKFLKICFTHIRRSNC